MQFSLFDGNKKLRRVGEPVDLEEIGIDRYFKWVIATKLSHQYKDTIDKSWSWVEKWYEHPIAVKILMGEVELLVIIVSCQIFINLLCKSYAYHWKTKLVINFITPNSNTYAIRRIMFLEKLPSSSWWLL